MASERFQALIDNSSDVISLVNAEGQVLYANASTAKVLGYHPEELLGSNGLELLHPQDRDNSVRTIRKVMEVPQSQNRMQARVRQKNGQWLWVESTACNLLDEPGVGAILLNYREIAARKAEEEERHRLTEELTRHNVELQAFAHTVAHDLSEPLRTISGFTELLVRNANLGAEDKELAQFIVQGVRRMSSQLNNLLASATTRFVDSLRPVDLEHAVVQAIQNLNESLTSSAAVVNVESLPTVQGNELDLIRVFQNLISNAVKYRGRTPAVIRISAELAGPDWIIRVRDNGIGISKENHRRVFGLFTRLHNMEVEGSGLGLAVCKRIVEGLGGTIWVESEPGLGSTFSFILAAEPLKISR